MPLSVQFAAFAEVGPSSQVLDVGCGPGALTGELVRLVGAENVLACDPSEPFVAACAARHPGVDVGSVPPSRCRSRRLGRRGATAARSTNSERIN